MQRKSLLAITAVLIGTLTAGCIQTSRGSWGNGAGSTPASAGPVIQQPVQLRLLDASRMPADTFQSAVTDLLLKRQPMIKIEPIVYPEGTDWRTLLAGESPDLALIPLSELESGQAANEWLDLSGVIQEMTVEVRKLGQLPKDTDPLNGAEKIRSTEGTYGLLPPGKGASLYFNKDIFDKFGIPYPAEGLTWGETKELTARLTRVDREIRYVGFAADRSLLLNHMSKLAPLANPQSERAQLMSEKWIPWLAALKSVYDVPGMEVEGMGRDLSKNRFIQKGDVAMWAGNFIYPPLEQMQRRVGRIPLPSFDSELAGSPGLPAGYVFVVPKTARHPKEALYAVAGIVTTPNRSRLEAAALGELGLKFSDVLAGQKDLNTAFREAEEIVEIRRKAGQIQ
ncbi:ABC transporter substrate-binding protein [Paenibacillus oceani]|uniref:Extracellular solute-binding protein n=1 Tax=Paenibacillus oceani TaxID=2772510 RepID=A0A927CFQ5_9BACL|nr:extracellular solute-binding protein [Paenibacillus oceani]MBD2866619.1 extracellular solute-binding protein [Paenibacillus oceani]